MTQQLLTFSKGGAPIKKTIEVNRFIREAAEFSARSSKLPRDVSLASPLERIDIDHGQMTQALHQLILNANHAMPLGGKVRGSGETRTLGPQDDLPLPHGKYVKIAVSDAGVGIPKNHLPNIFDPYFTTKSDGSGHAQGVGFHFELLLTFGGFYGVLCFKTVSKRILDGETSFFRVF